MLVSSQPNNDVYYSFESRILALAHGCDLVQVICVLWYAHIYEKPSQQPLTPLRTHFLDSWITSLFYQVPFLSSLPSVEESSVWYQGSLTRSFVGIFEESILSRGE